jgi:hypothetical protein
MRSEVSATPPPQSSDTGSAALSEPIYRYVRGPRQARMVGRGVDALLGVSPFADGGPVGSADPVMVGESCTGSFLPSSLVEKFEQLTKAARHAIARRTFGGVVYDYSPSFIVYLDGHHETHEYAAARQQRASAFPLVAMEGGRA